MQLAKYPRVLYVKPSNKIYLNHDIPFHTLWFIKVHFITYLIFLFAISLQQSNEIVHKTKITLSCYHTEVRAHFIHVQAVKCSLTKLTRKSSSLWHRHILIQTLNHMPRGGGGGVL